MLIPRTNIKITHFLFIVLCFSLFNSSEAKTYTNATPLPEFTNTKTDEWFNSVPLKLSDIKGKVVLLDFWTYGCWNCYRSFPWMHELEEKLAPEDFQVIGIHTPEFGHEKVANNVAEKIKQFKLKHPVMMDNNFVYWNSLNNRYWPTFYLIDKKGQLRYSHIGETHSGDRNAQAIEAEILQLLNE